MHQRKNPSVLTNTRPALLVIWDCISKGGNFSNSKYKYTNRDILWKYEQWPPFFHQLLLQLDNMILYHTMQNEKIICVMTMFFLE